MFKCWFVCITRLVNSTNPSLPGLRPDPSLTYPTSTVSSLTGPTPQTLACHTRLMYCLMPVDLYWVYHPHLTRIMYTQPPLVTAHLCCRPDPYSPAPRTPASQTSWSQLYSPCPHILIVFNSLFAARRLSFPACNALWQIFSKESITTRCLAFRLFRECTTTYLPGGSWSTPRLTAARGYRRVTSYSPLSTAERRVSRRRPWNVDAQCHLHSFE